MKIIKYFETRLNIDDPAHFLTCDYNATIINILKERFVNICFKSAFILEILEISRRSNLHCKNKDLGGGVYVDIQFKASCIVYESGDIIHKCKILQMTDKNVILARSDKAAIHIKNIAKIDVFKQNDVIPVIVREARYNLYDNLISVSAIPFMPITKDGIHYRVSAALSPDLKLKEHYDTINDITGKIKKFPADAVRFFTNIIYPYKKYVKYDKYNKTSLDKIHLKEGDIVFDGEKYINEQVFYLAKKPESILAESLFDIDGGELTIRLLLENIKNLNILLEFLENYNLDQIKSNTIIWSVYTKLKK